MKDIVVLAGSTPWSVLSLCKCATKHKTKAIVVCIGNGWGSKYSNSRFVYKAYDVQEFDLDVFWINFFKENLFAEEPILYVTSDYACQIVEQRRPFYEQNFTLCVASSYIISSFIDKNIASVEAAKNGLKVPRTQEVHSEDDIKYVCKNFVFPVIVKPVTFRDHRDAKFKTQICFDARQFCEFIKPYFANRVNLQCQEYIQGEDKNCVFYQFYRDIDGNILECMGEKTLQTNGIMTIGTTKYDESLAALCREFLQRIDYVGIGGIEFKRYGGEYYFIEMSTRTEGFLPISDMAGVSLAEASFLSLNGNLFKKCHQQENVRYAVFKTLYNAGLTGEGVFHLFKQIMKIILSPKDRFVGSFLDFPFAVKLDLGILK